MKNRLITFLRFLEIETNIDIHFQSLSAPDKFIDSNGKRCCANIIIIGTRPLLLKIISSITRGEKRILGLEIQYVDDSGISEAKHIQEKIKKVVPLIPVLHKNLFDDMQMKSLIRNN